MVHGCSSMSKLLFAVILVTSLIVRVQRIDYPLSDTFSWGDGTRDYLVANHIIKFSEFPLIGPFNLLSDGGIKSSSLYYYLLALPLLLSSSILSLSVASIVLSLTTLILIYMVAKALFDAKTALIALVLISFNPELIRQDFVWQPYFMQSFVYLSLLLATPAFFSNNKFLFLMSAVIFSFAIAMHHAALSFLPAFLGGAYYLKILPKTILTFIVCIFIFYSPVIFFYLSSSPASYISSSLSSVFVPSIGSYLNNIYLNTKTLLNSLGINLLLSLLLLIISFVFFTRAQESLKKKLLLLIILFILPIICASLINKIRLHYLFLSFGVFIIFISKLVAYLIENSSQKLKIAGIFLFFILFMSSTFNFNFLTESKSPLENLKKINHLSSEIENELKGIQKKEGFLDLSFFQVASYIQKDSIYHYPILDTLLLVPLEERLNRRLVQISDTSPYNHIQINSDHYIIVSCPKFAIKNQNQCLETFFKERPSYSLVKEISSDYHLEIYLTKRI